MHQQQVLVYRPWLWVNNKRVDRGLAQQDKNKHDLAGVKQRMEDWVLVI